MTLTAEHKRKMQAGRKRASRERQRDARRRVAAYRAWLRRGCVGPPPEIPTDADYRLAGAARVRVA